MLSGSLLGRRCQSENCTQHLLHIFILPRFSIYFQSSLFAVGFPTCAWVCLLAALIGLVSRTKHAHFNEVVVGRLRRDGRLCIFVFRRVRDGALIYHNHISSETLFHLKHTYLGIRLLLVASTAPRPAPSMVLSSHPRVIRRVVGRIISLLI